MRRALKTRRACDNTETLNVCLAVWSINFADDQWIEEDYLSVNIFKRVILNTILIWIVIVSGPGEGIAALSNESVPSVKSILEKRQQNVVLQQWELSCAAAALATILRYQYQMPVTERSVALGLIDRQEYQPIPGWYEFARASLF